MNALLRLGAALSAVALSLSAHGALISDFSNLAGQFPSFGGSWSAAGVSQYSQGSGFISILPQGSGNPLGDGYFFASMPSATSPGGNVSMNLTGFSSISLTGRVDSGNASSNIGISFYDSSLTKVAGATLDTSSFTSNFSTLTASLTLTGVGNLSQVTYWRIEGDGSPTNAFRYSFDNLTVAVPEPSATALGLLGLGAAGLCFFRRRERSPAPARIRKP